MLRRSLLAILLAAAGCGATHNAPKDTNQVEGRLARDQGWKRVTLRHDGGGNYRGIATTKKDERLMIEVRQREDTFRVRVIRTIK